MTALHSSIADGVVTLRLASPETANALSPQTFTALAGEIVRWQAPDSGARVLVLTGAGTVFSAGADLDVLNDCDPARLAAAMRDAILPLHALLAQSRLPTIAAVNGPAVGGAVGLALMFDIVLAARSARFSLAFARLGLIPDTGLTHLLPRLVGEARARAWMMTGADIVAEEAAATGMILRCVDDAALPAETAALATQLAQLPGGAHHLIREAVVAARSASFEQQVAFESHGQAERVVSTEFRAAMSAFAARRTRSTRG